MRVRSTFGTCEMYMLYYTNMSHCDPGLLQDWEDEACWWECRGRQPFAGARGVLASSFLSAAAGGQYHLNKEKFAKGGIRMILEKRKIFDGQKDMISTLDLETRARPFDDARVEAQSALRQQPITPAEVLDQAGRELRVAGDRQPRRQEQPT